MCRLAIHDTARSEGVFFELSDIEINRPGPSYTIDTVRELKKKGWGQVHWLIGADMLNFLPNWHQAAALLREAVFFVMARPDAPIDWQALPEEFAALKKNLVQTPLIQISSSDIRRRVRQGLSIDYLTPPAVAQYIHDRGLYR